MRKSPILPLLLVLLLPLTILGQRGQPFVTDIPFERGLGEVRVSGLLQTADRNMLLCTSRGILVFDGAVWELIPTPSPPITMAESEDGSVYVGMRKGAAKLAMTDSGSFRLKPLLPSILQESIHQILVTEALLYLVSDSRMLTLDIEKLDTLATLNFGDRLFSGAFLQFDIPHLLFYQEGLFSYQNDKLTRIGNFGKLAEHQLVFNLNAKRGTFLCFDNGDMLLFDGIRTQAVGGSLGSFLHNSRPSDGVILNDTLIAISTLDGGTVVADARNLEVLHRLNLTTGLPDNEVTAVGRDDHGGLWMSYASGISRLDLMHPISRYHNYPGLKGTVTGTVMKGDDLYVSTGNGVFVLRESQDRAEMQRAMAERVEAMNVPEPRPQFENKRMEQQVVVKTDKHEVDAKSALVAKYETDPGAVKKELSRKELRELRKHIKDSKKKSGKEKDDEQEVASEPKPEPVEEAAIVQESEKIVVAPKAKVTEKRAAPITKRSTEAGAGAFLFRAVKGLDMKCKQLTVVNNSLFAATGSGVFLIENESAVNLTPGLYVNHISATRDGQTLLLATIKGAYTLRRDGGKWALLPVHEDHRNSVYNVIEDQRGNLWAGADNAVLRFVQTKEGFVPREFTLDNGQLERVLVAELAGAVHLLVPSGILLMEENGPVKANIAGLENRSRLDFFLSDSGPVWVHAEGEWTVLNSGKDQTLLTYLPIFEDIRHLSIDRHGRLLVVDEGREIYSIDPRQATGPAAAFSVFIRKAIAEDRTPFSMGELTVKAGDNSLTFQLSAPFYLKSMATEYQYRVEGLRNSWSRWNNSPTIEIPFLPAGEYVLYVRARNVLGEVSEVRTLAFTVLKPLWQRWYAILFYVAVLVGIVWLIIKGRERSLWETQRELEEKVQERTAELASEKERTEKLLLNILPKETAEELQKRGKATARHYNQVSVLFTDFKGFTRFAESTKPEDLVQELDRCFIAFDDIIEKYHLEKIKTIGDAYMCAGGVPIRNTNNAVAIVLAAIEIRDFMLKLQQEKQERNERFWEIRLGISTGPLTAGVVGKKKFAYDIWGDTVNTASRMESTSEPGMVNISASTYELVKDYFDCTYRGKKDAKGKGEVDMYFVNGIRREFSENGDGKTPNEALQSIVA
jgi:class 3 adenylate cyclase/ligand-binding sensor domain-containing protein